SRCPRPDVGIQSKDVFRIVSSFEARKPRVVLAEILRHRIASDAAGHVVAVEATGGRLQVTPEPLGVVELARRIADFPTDDEDHAMADGTVGECVAPTGIRLIAPPAGRNRMLTRLPE